MINLKDEDFDKIHTVIAGAVLLFAVISPSILINIVEGKTLVIVQLSILTLTAFVVFVSPLLIKLHKYESEALNKKISEMFPHILNENFKIQDKTLAPFKTGVIVVKDGKLKFYGNLYISETAYDQEKRFKENLQYAIDILNTNKKLV